MAMATRRASDSIQSTPISTMPSKDSKIYRMDLSRVVVDGNLQSINRVATLSLKHEDQNRYMMQVHVDGTTLAIWDLGLLIERKASGGEQFLSIAEQKMLQFTLPLQEEGQHDLRGSLTKTVQLFIVKHQDFHTAVSYLSKDAGMRHISLRNSLPSVSPVDAAAPQHLFERPRFRESSGNSILGPPKQAVSQFPGLESRLESRRETLANDIGRPFSTTPSRTYVRRDTALLPRRPLSAFPAQRRIPPPVYRYSPNVPRGPRGFITPGGSSQIRRLPSRSPGETGLGDGIQSHEYHVRGISQDNRISSVRLIEYEREPMLHHQDKEVADPRRIGSHCHTIHGEYASQTGHLPSSAPSIGSQNTYFYAEHPSSATPFEITPSRPHSVSENALPIMIQFIHPSDANNYPYSNPKTLWEFSLNFLPSTKIRQLCLHAASFLNREFHANIDGRAIVARSRDGFQLDGHASLSWRIIEDQTLFLVELRPLDQIDVIQSSQTSLRETSADPLHPEWPPSEVFNREGVTATSPKEIHYHAVNASDQVPPPRKMPFPTMATAPSARSGNKLKLTRPPSIEMQLDLVNSSTHALVEIPAKQSSKENLEPTTAPKKKPATRKLRPQSALARSATTARRSHTVSDRDTARQPEATTSTRRSVICKQQTNGSESPSQEIMSVTTAPAVDATPSGAETRKEELAATACMGCRNKKRTCDRIKPACTPCLRDSRKCIYPKDRHTHTKNMISHAEDVDKAQCLETNKGSRAKAQAEASVSTMENATTQTRQEETTLDIGVQTQEYEHRFRDVEMKDVGTDPCSLSDVGTETDMCDDTWLPFFQCAKVVMWAGKQYEAEIQRAANILSATDPFQKDYKDRVQLAAARGQKFEEELREKCEEVLRWSN